MHDSQTPGSSRLPNTCLRSCRWEHRQLAAIALTYFSAALVVTARDNTWTALAVIGGLVGFSLSLMALWLVGHRQTRLLHLSPSPHGAQIETPLWTLLSVFMYSSPLALMLLASAFAWQFAATACGVAAAILGLALVDARVTRRLERARQAGLFRVIPKRGRMTLTHTYTLTPSQDRSH
jgi:hypothetical protein